MPPPNEPPPNEPSPIEPPPTDAPQSAQNLAVLFADVAGSTRLYETLGDARALELVNQCLAIVQQTCESHGGRLIKTIGDEAMTVFPAADACAEAAAAIQGEMAELPPAGAIRLALRVGFHYGAALQTPDDVFGDSVNVAARMVALAKGGQVITTSTTVDALSPWLKARLRQLDTLTVKGKQKDIGIFELMWQDSAEEMTMLSTRQKVKPVRMIVRHGGKELVMGEDLPGLSLGRDPLNDVVVTDRMASRMHARIERRRDKFVLVDQSSNGTFVTIDGEREIVLRREELVLRRKGRISFGHPYQADPAEALEFVCMDEAE